MVQNAVEVEEPRVTTGAVAPRWKQSPRLWLILAFWMAAMIGGATLLWKYASTPGIAATPPETWPAQSVIAREPGRATIVMLAHPRCPCTRASIAELAVLMQRVGDRARAHVLFVRPRDVDPGWEKSALYQRAAEISGVTVHSDPGGMEARLFRALTSGQTVVYDVAGRLLFRGGITGSRGHEGDNIGLQRALSLIKGGQADDNESLVFGCALDKQADQKGNPSR